MRIELKKIVAISFALCMLVTMSVIGVATAQPTADIVPSTQDVSPGESFDVSVFMDTDGHKLVVGRVEHLTFDGTVVETTAGDVVPGDLLVTPSVATKQVNNTAGTVRFDAGDIDWATQTPPGNYMNVTFTVKATAAPGTYPINITWMRFMDETAYLWVTPELAVTNGTFTVTGDLPPPDETAPTTTVTPTPAEPASGWWNTDVILSFHRVDNGGGNVTGVAYTNYSMSGATVPDWQTEPGDTDFTVNVTAEGETTVSYFSVDNAGNPETPTKTVIVRIDTVDPQIISVDLDTTTPGAAGPLLVTVNATDALSGVATVTANGDPLTKQNGVWNGTITAKFLPGTYNVTVVATDEAGNPVTDDTQQYTIGVEYGVNLTADDDKTIKEGETATYTLTVENTGNTEDTINLTIVTGPGALSAQSVTLAANTNTTVTLTVQGGTVGTFATTVNATSQGDVNKTASVTVTTSVERIVRRSGGGGWPKDSDGDGFSDIVEWLQGSDPNDPCDPDPNSEACLAAATPTPATPTPATPTPKPTVAVPPPVTTKPPAATPTPTPEEPGFGAVFAIAGLLAVAYLVLRRKQE